MKQWSRKAVIPPLIAFALSGCLAVALCHRVRDHAQPSSEGMVLSLDRSEAQQFCEWITLQHRRSGIIGPAAVYRISTFSRMVEKESSQQVLRWPLPIGGEQSDVID